MWGRNTDILKTDTHYCSHICLTLHHVFGLFYFIFLLFWFFFNLATMIMCKYTRTRFTMPIQRYFITEHLWILRVFMLLGLLQLFDANTQSSHTLLDNIPNYKRHCCVFLNAQWQR